jgi:hypothetical protein
MTDQDRAPFDPRIADWLEGDPNTAPEPTLEIVLAAFPSIKQRHGSRLPWRFSLMPTSFKLALGAAAVFVVVLGGAFALGPGSPNSVGGPGSTPSPSPITTQPPSSPEAQATVPVDWTTYTSSRFAYTIDYPADWVATPATQDWPSTGFPSPMGGFDHDTFGPPYFGSPVYVASIALKAGTTAADWLVALDGEGAAHDCQMSTARTVVVDGVDARRREGVCMSTDRMIEVAMADDRRFYLIYMFGTPAGPFTDADHATLDRFLASFRFGG